MAEFVPLLDQNINPINFYKSSSIFCDALFFYSDLKFHYIYTAAEIENIMNFFLHLLATLLVFATLDVIWLKVLLGGLVEYPFVAHFGNRPNWPLAEIYYVMTAVWLAFGAAYKSMVFNNAAPAFLDGLKIGFRFSVIYAAVNIVFFQPWTIELAVLDIGWHTFATAVAAVASYAIGVWLTSSSSAVVKK